LITVDLRSRKPIYEQLVDNIRHMILSGEMKPDEQLPSVRALASELGINPNTIQKAYNELERLGAVYSLKGRGNFVAGDTAALGRDALREIESGITALLRQAKENGTPRGDVEARLTAMVDAVYGEGEN